MDVLSEHNYCRPPAEDSVDLLQEFDLVSVCRRFAHWSSTRVSPFVSIISLDSCSATPWTVIAVVRNGMLRGNDCGRDVVFGCRAL